jgi:hypothetical protein
MPIRPRSGRSRVCAPEKNRVAVRSGLDLEAEHLAALGIGPGHDVLDGAVFSRCIHRLKDESRREGT